MTDHAAPSAGRRQKQGKPGKIQPRILPLPREEWTDAAREVFSFWGEPNAWEEGSKTNIVMVTANHPDLGKAYNIWGKRLLLSNTLPTRQLELIVLRIAWRMQSEYEWHYHVGYGLNAGLTLDEIAAIGEDPARGEWSEEDAAVIQSVDDLIDAHRISDETWARLGKYYDRRQLMDLVFTIGHYVMTGWALSSFGVELEAPDPIGFDLKTASGKSPVADYKPGEKEN